MSARQVPDDGRDLTSELAAAIAELSEGNAALIVLSRQDQLRFLSGDMSVLKGK